MSRTLPLDRSQGPRSPRAQVDRSHGPLVWAISSEHRRKPGKQTYRPRSSAERCPISCKGMGDCNKRRHKANPEATEHVAYSPAPPWEGRGAKLLDFDARPEMTRTSK